MAELNPAIATAYTSIIDDILAASDLNTISAKRIRKGLQERVGHDISHQKEQITSLIMQRFDAFNSAHNPAANGSNTSAPPSPPAHTHTHSSTNGATKKRATPSSPASPPPKKPRAARPAPESDASLAKRLQQEEDAASRRTRGAGTKRKAAPVPKKRSATVSKRKKKSAKRVGGDDDSEGGSGAEDEEGGGGAKARRKNGGFHKPMHLSPPLAALLATPILSRPQVVKQIWAYVKEHELQDPADKRVIRCDEPLRKVFGVARVHMFTMNKILGGCLWPVEGVEGADGVDGVGGEVKKEGAVKEEEEEGSLPDAVGSEDGDGVGDGHVDIDVDGEGSEEE